jgi:arsenate reductase-like glutaredoxin family protein
MDASNIEAKEVVPASRKLSRKEAAELIKAASKIIVSKGRNVRSFPGGQAKKEIVEAMLGPTGNLRAPTVRVGRTLLVGFDEESFQEALQV